MGQGYPLGEAQGEASRKTSKRSWTQAGDGRSWACLQELPHLALPTHFGTLGSLLLNHKLSSLCWQEPTGPCDCWHVDHLPSHHYECSLWGTSLGRLWTWCLVTFPEARNSGSWRLIFISLLVSERIKSSFKEYGKSCKQTQIKWRQRLSAYTHTKTSPTIGKSCSPVLTTGFWFTDDSVYFYCHY